MFLVLSLLSSCPVSPEAEKRAFTGVTTAKKGISQATNIGFLWHFGGAGTEKGKFLAISGISARDGLLFVGDEVLSRVQVFDYEGEFLYSFGSGVNTKESVASYRVFALNLDAKEEQLLKDDALSALAKNQLFRTSDIALYDGEVFVLNSLQSAPNDNKARLRPGVLRFSTKGEYLGFLSVGALSPAFLDVDENEGKLVVSDFLNNGFFYYDLINEEVLFKSNPYSKSSFSDFLSRVYRVPDVRRARQIFREWTNAGSGEKQFDVISGVAFYKDKILAVDRMNKRIKVFSRDGDLLATVTPRQSPNRPVLFDDPVDIAVSKEGIVFISDASSIVRSVLAFTTKFQPLFSLSHPLMKRPSQIAVSEDNYIFVTDLASQEIFVFGPLHKRFEEGQDKKGSSLPAEGEDSL